MRLHRLLLSFLLFTDLQLLAQQLPGITPTNHDAKPSLFSALPDSFLIRKDQLQKIFNLPLNSAVDLPLSDEFSIIGILTEKIQHTPGSVSVNIRLSNFKNALFNATLSLQADNSASIQGRILNPRYNDVLMIYKERDNYFIRKSSLRLYMPD